MINYRRLIISVIICQAAGVIGSIFTASSVSTWYVTLNKPSFTPPGWIFGPVWILLYFLMGISLYLLWNKKKEAKTALIFFSVQLLLNIAWSFFFFGLQLPLFAFIDIVFLWITILLTMIYSRTISKMAVYLFLPYLFWVSFALVLNYFLVILN